MTQPTTPTDEINALRRIAATLDRLDPAARARAVGWLFDVYRAQEADEEAE